MTTTILFDAAVEAGPGPLGNGDLVVVLVDADSWTPVETMVHLDEVTDELSGGGYTRATLTVTVDWLGTRYRALPDSTPQITHGHTGPLWVVVARDGTDDTDRAMVRADLIESPAQPLEPSWPDGILSVSIHTGIETLVEGDGIEIDSSDPQHPTISATGGGGTGEIADLQSTGAAAGLYAVTDGAGGVTLEPVPTGGGGGGDVDVSWRYWPDVSQGQMGTWALDVDVPTGDDPPTIPVRLVSLAETSYIGSIVGESPGPHVLGSVHTDHAPMESQILIPTQWASQYTMTGGPALMAIMSDGSVMVMDLTGSLDDTDEVILSLSGARWLALA